MAYGLSKLHQSTEIVDNNGATQGTIIHTGNIGDYAASTFTVTSLGSTTSNTTLTIAPSNGLDSVISFRGRIYGSVYPTVVGKLSDMSASATYPIFIYSGSTVVAKCYRNTDGTQITVFDLAAAGTLHVEELKVI